AIRRGIDFAADSALASGAEFPARGREQPCLTSWATERRALKTGSVWYSWLTLPLWVYAPYAAADDEGTSGRAGTGTLDATIPILLLRWSGRFTRPTLSSRTNGKWRSRRRAMSA